MSAIALAGLNAILIDDAHRPPAHLLRVIIISEGKL